MVLFIYINISIFLPWKIYTIHKLFGRKLSLQPQTIIYVVNRFTNINKYNTYLHTYWYTYIYYHYYNRKCFKSAASQKVKVVPRLWHQVHCNMIFIHYLQQNTCALVFPHFKIHVGLYTKNMDQRALWVMHDLYTSFPAVQIQGRLEGIGTYTYYIHAAYTYIY